MSPENKFLDNEVRARLRKLLEKRYPDLPTLYPGKNIESLEDEQLYEIVGEEKPIQEVLGEPSIRTAYQAVRTNFPDYEIEFTSLVGGQLERLARGTEAINKVLDKNQYEPKSKERTFADIARPPRKPAIGNHYYPKGEPRVHSLGLTSSRRGFNPPRE